jgi:phosphomannomutase
MNCFKTYDVRGKVPHELNPEIARQIAAAYVDVLQPARVAVGYDCRLTSPELAAAIVEGLLAQGADVYELGLCGTEEVYHAAFAGKLDGGIMVTASHNPAEYNGLKMVARHGAPLTAEQLGEIKQRVGDVRGSRRRGAVLHRAWREQYIDFLAEMFPPESLAPLKTLANAGNGSIGPLLRQLAQRFGLNVELLLPEPDGTFPNGIPNPLLPEKRELTSRAVLEHGADLGVAWDGDFDRCFFFDRKGTFLESYYLVGMFGRHFLQEGPAPVCYDPRLTWNTVEVVEEAGGTPLICPTGHVFFKQKLRESGAVYGGEMSGHHYFQRFGCCDSGVLPWLLWLQIQNKSYERLEDYIHSRAQRFPVSGEINRSVTDQQQVLRSIRERYQSEVVSSSDIDGVSFDFAEWRFNLRSSNTEPLIRLNVETRGDADLLQRKTSEILELVDAQAARV